MSCHLELHAQGHAQTGAECWLIQDFQMLEPLYHVVLCPLDVPSTFLHSSPSSGVSWLWTHPQPPLFSLLVGCSQWEAQAADSGWEERDIGLFISLASSLLNYGVTSKPLYPEIVPRAACLPLIPQSLGRSTLPWVLLSFSPGTLQLLRYLTKD